MLIEPPPFLQRLLLSDGLMDTVWQGWLRRLLRSLSLGLTPVGGWVYYDGEDVPDGWLWRDGSAVSRSTYAALFGVLGTRYGSGDGSTTFNLPDGRGTYALTKAAAGTGSTLGGTFGQLDHTHSIANESAHTHAVSGTTGAGGSVGAGTTGAGGGFSPGTTGAAGAHDHGGATSVTGMHDHTGSTGDGNLSVTARTTDLTGLGTTFDTVDDPAHQHAISDDGDHDHAIASQGDHAHSSPGQSDHTHSTPSQGTHTHSVSITSAAGSAHTHTEAAANVATLVSQSIIKY